MAYGNTVPGDKGSYQQKPPRKTEPPEVPEPAEQPPTEPTDTAPPPAPPVGGEDINETYVANIARESLPKNEDFLDFVNFSREQLPSLVADVVRASGHQPSDFQNRMDEWLKTITQAEADLNKKTEPSPAPPAPIPIQPLPGTKRDELCTSTFDANDLALRGRKSVLKKSFHLPVIFPQILLVPTQAWAFGQKVEYSQEWRHEGFTLGELISSLSLLPNEELTVEISSWQRTKTEIAEETDQERRERLERELRRTDEESTVNEAAVSNGWTISATGSVTYGPVSASASATTTGNVSERSEQAEKHVVDATSRAANEVSLRRAVKMTQTAEAGSEQRTSRRIRNPNTCHTVTFNFFQIVKLYDVQLRLDNDAMVVMLPGLFPVTYTAGERAGQEVAIPYWTIESFTSPAVFLTQFFEVDRDLCKAINGWSLRVRMDAGRAPSIAISQLAIALIVATKYLLRLDPATVVAPLAAVVSNYVHTTVAMRRRSANTYGVDRGRSEQITTPGVYVDSLVGRCTACEDYVEASRFVDILRQHEDVNRVKQDNALAAQEVERRKKLLDTNVLDPFEPRPPHSFKVDVSRGEETA